MTWLIAGLLIWMIVHLMPAAAPGVRGRLVALLGENPYKGLFALDILLGLGLIVVGWRSTVPEIVYLPPVWGRTAALPLMAIAIFLLGAAQRPSAVKRFLRHPMLTGVVVWSVAHLLANGELRSVVMFGGLGIWALLEMVLINRRDGPRSVPDAPPLVRELIGAVIAVVILVVLIWLHPYFAGVALSFG